jgi:hypothetical protein
MIFFYEQLKINNLDSHLLYSKRTYEKHMRRELSVKSYYILLIFNM